MDGCKCIGIDHRARKLRESSAAAWSFTSELEPGVWLLAASCQTLTYQFLEKLDGGGPSEVSGIFHQPSLNLSNPLFKTGRRAAHGPRESSGWKLCRQPGRWPRPVPGRAGRELPGRVRLRPPRKRYNLHQFTILLSVTAVAISIGISLSFSSLFY